MAAAAISRSLHRLSLRLRLRRGLASSSNTNTTASFDWSDDDDDDDDEKKNKKKTTTKSSPLPPPYDPFKKNTKNTRRTNPAEDPSNLQEVFHRMRTDGLMGHAVKMLDALPRDEALRLFSTIKDRGTMPDVVAHTAVIEAYADAPGHSKDALRTFHRMLASGVAPNAYTYAVLLRALAADAATLPQGRAYLLEMIDKGMRPNAATYLSVFQAYIARHMMDDARSLLDEMTAKGFAPDEKAVREQLGNRGQTFRAIMTLLFSK